MSSNIASLTPETTLDEAWGMICEHRFRHIPIVSSEGKLVGIISDRDLLLRAALISASDTVFQEQAGNTIADIMKTQILTATPSTEIHQIARVMFEKKVGAMPILNEHGNLVGMITRSDILRALIRQELSE